MSCQVKKCNFLLCFFALKFKYLEGSFNSIYTPLLASGGICMLFFVRSGLCLLWFWLSFWSGWVQSCCSIEGWESGIGNGWGRTGVGGGFDGGAGDWLRVDMPWMGCSVKLLMRCPG